jgi:hypothetical protein
MALPPPSEGSTALVTGASSGIGEQFARQLAERGHGVTLVARRTDRLQALAAELRERHRVRVEVVGCDLAEPAARDELFAAVDGLGLAVEILVNNAGAGVYAAFTDSEREDELRILRLNVEALTDLAHRYLPAMRDRRRGAIVNMSSTSGLQPLPFNATYAAGKAYVLLLSEALHAEARAYGVTVTAVLPGPVRTEWQEANDATFAERMPKAVFAPPERVAADALAAAERGRRSVIPGGPAVKAAFGPNRFVPRAVTNAVALRLMRK